MVYVYKHMHFFYFSALTCNNHAYGTTMFEAFLQPNNYTYTYYLTRLLNLKTMFLVFFRPNDNIKLNYHFEICHNRVNWNYHMELLNNRLMFILCVFTDSIYRSINNILFQHVISIPIYNLEIKSILELLTQCKIY